MVMGRAYEDGRGVPKDLDQPAAWYERASAGGHHRAMFRLARLLLDGEPTPTDDPGRAVKLLQTAAEAGVPGAQNDLGWSYETGKGVARDPSLAARWYMRAAASGDGKRVGKGKRVKRS